MSSTKKRTMKLGPLLEEAIKKKGLALPTTEEEIAAIERELASDSSPVPARLLVPPDFSAKEPSFRLRPRQAVIDAAEEMARAARGGGDIPKDVEEKMARDRAAAASTHRDKSDEEK